MQQYTSLIEEFPNDATAYHRLAVLRDEHGSSEASAPLYRSALKLAPLSADILCDYGYSRYLSGDLELAERTLRQAIELDEHLERAHNNLALVLASQGKHEQAVASFKNAGLSQREAQENLRQSQIAARLSATAAEELASGLATESAEPNSE